MKKLSVKDIIEFRSKSDRSKKNFAVSLKIDKVKESTDGGGDYWVSSISSISNYYKSNKISFIFDKITELEEKIKVADYQRTKDMYLRNAKILNNFKKIKLNRIRPEEISEFIRKSKIVADFMIEGLLIKVQPQFVFSFAEGKERYVGAVWFIAKLGGISPVDLRIYSDILFRYLAKTNNKDIKISRKFCIAFDVVNMHYVRYFDIESAVPSSNLLPTIKEIKNLM